jgi:hypothetical protein
MLHETFWISEIALWRIAHKLILRALPAARHKLKTWRHALQNASEY